MKSILKHLALFVSVTNLVTSCNTLQKAAVHGLTSGYYTLTSDDKIHRKVYLDVTPEQLAVYPHTQQLPDKNPFLTVSLLPSDSLLNQRLIFKKQSLDIDITSILLKYRPPVQGLPAQIHTDLNVALYAGWRYDRYQIKSQQDPLGRGYQKISTLGYDFGFFAGPGTTVISPFNTLNRRADEYNGIILQAGVAGFVESTVASFGLSLGYDYLMNPDRKIWIYRNKPWVGFIIGIALN